MLRKCLLKGSEFECWNQGILHYGDSTDLIDFLSYPTMRDQTIMNLLKKEKAI